MNRKQIIACGAGATLLLGSCANLSDTEQRTLTGAGIGTVAGVAVGAITGDGWWAAAGAAAGAATGYLVDLAGTPDRHTPAVVYVISAVFVFAVAAIVVTFLILMRQGYRWARTLLTGGGIASVVYVTTNLFTVERATTAALIYAVTAIFGSVLIAGGVFLLHRKDAQAFFTR